MAFTDDDIAVFTEQIERILWTHRRPPLHLRNMVREGQSYVRSRNIWKVYWRRGDGKWHPYEPCPETSSLEEWLRLVNKDENGCFWG